MDRIGGTCLGEGMRWDEEDLKGAAGYGYGCGLSCLELRRWYAYGDVTGISLERKDEEKEASNGSTQASKHASDRKDDWR
ncbi:uncharacterized protein An03g04300 [Aspergillus niger]|uniref:Contig An03c0120, genomic contig n=2 Tax=Aspergillus niger TaxID=5061 RepID=A2QGS2_ASPNC|nr:uncharacterized protein An03g04300 [Aspergillus niger]CAK47869.1 unnamed protein product [Aspergillus niger]